MMTEKDTEMVMTGAENADYAPDFGGGDEDLLDMLDAIATDEIDNESVDIARLDAESKEKLNISDEEPEDDGV